jgi:hypothetical protein
MLLVLWVLQLSIVHVGQLFWGYGWETQLLETGFLAIFLVPLFDGRPFPRSRPSRIVIGLYWWLIARIMLGAGLIKMRGDAVWSWGELSALFYHFETQPIPNGLSWYFHNLPHADGCCFQSYCRIVCACAFVPAASLAQLCRLAHDLVPASPHC